MRLYDIFRTEDNTVSKYIHEDGSETAIKMVKSVQNIFNPLTNEIESRESDRNKYSIFISSSVGCFMKCKFCHLTLKNSEFIKLEEYQIFNNLKEAIQESIQISNQNLLNYPGCGWVLNCP